MASLPDKMDTWKALRAPFIIACENCLHQNRCIGAMVSKLVTGRDAERCEAPDRAIRDKYVWNGKRNDWNGKTK